MQFNEFNELSLKKPKSFNILKCKNSPLISVIVPVYNCEKYIAKTLNSLLNQSLENIEIICVDDKSNDNSLSIIKNYAKKDKRIKVIANKKNLGVSNTRNIALKKSSGNFIMFVDGDDYVSQDFCKKMYQTITKNNSNLAICNANVILDSNFNSTTRKVNLNRNYAVSSSRTLWNKIFRKSLIDKYNLKFPMDVKGGEDAYFTTCYNQICNNKIAILNEKLYNYVIRNNSVMSAIFVKDNKQMLDCFVVCDDMYKFYKKIGKVKDVYDKYFANINFGIKMFSEKNYDMIANVIYKSIKNKPEIKIYDDCFRVNNKDYKINKNVFDKIKNLSNNRNYNNNLYR